MGTALHRSIHASSRLVKHELLADRRYHPNLGGITRGGLANHFPMTILALHGLGASDEEVTAFIESWPRQRAPVDETGLGLVDRHVVTATNWPEFLGRSEYLLEFRRVFEEGLTGPQGLRTVTHALSVMRDALPMGLFHPLIRLSFAVSDGDSGLIADALAYMAIRYFDLFRGELPKGTGTRALSSIWGSISPTNQQAVILDALDGASIRICEHLCADTDLQREALDFELTRPTLPQRMREIAGLALRLYVNTPSLTTLHAVTSVQALAELTQALGDTDEREIFVALWARYWVWLTALYIEKGQPALPTAPSAAPTTDWSMLAARARAVPEVHLIKMAYSCRWLDEKLGPDPLYKIAVEAMLAKQSR